MDVEADPQYPAGLDELYLSPLHARSAADADIHLKDDDIYIYRTGDHPIGHAGTAERPRQRPK
jgi:hypothetical protein